MYRAIETLRRERAREEKERVLIESMMEEDELDDTIDAMLDDSNAENDEDDISDEELEDILIQMPDDDDEEEQVDRVANAEEDLSADQILGIDEEDDVDMDEVAESLIEEIRGEFLKEGF